MGVVSMSRLPVPDDPRWLAEKALREAAIRAEAKRVNEVVRHVGHEELERRAKEAGRLYAQRLFLHDHKEAIRALKEGRR